MGSSTRRGLGSGAVDDWKNGKAIVDGGIKGIFVDCAISVYADRRNNMVDVCLDDPTHSQSVGQHRFKKWTLQASNLKEAASGSPNLQHSVKRSVSSDLGSLPLMNIKFGGSYYSRRVTLQDVGESWGQNGQTHDICSGSSSHR